MFQIPKIFRSSPSKIFSKPCEVKIWKQRFNSVNALATSRSFQKTMKWSNINWGLFGLGASALAAYQWYSNTNKASASEHAKETKNDPKKGSKETAASSQAEESNDTDKVKRFCEIFGLDTDLYSGVTEEADYDSLTNVLIENYSRHPERLIALVQKVAEAQQDVDVTKSQMLSLNYDSYMLPEADLPFGGRRLLEVDNPVVFPVNTPIRILITATDVLHAWALPNFGVKMDAVPGRLHQIVVSVPLQGVYYGQCSELCGVNHGFMPICVHVVGVDEFTKWMKTKIPDLSGKWFYSLKPDNIAYLTQEIEKKLGSPVGSFASLKQHNLKYPICIEG